MRFQVDSFNINKEFIVFIFNFARGSCEGTPFPGGFLIELGWGIVVKLESFVFQ